MRVRRAAAPSPLLPILLLLAAALPGSVARADGRIEINQASVDAQGGFPLVIASPGSYVLTSDLEVPADTQAIELATNDVHLDLNGFRISGPFTCSAIGCATGLVRGVGPRDSFGRRVTVTGGTIRGFSGICLLVLQESYVSEMFVSQCGNVGIQASDGSLVRATRVSQTGREGIVLVGDDAGFVDNVVLNTGQALATASVRGGKALGGNVCEDGGCSPPKRRFYVTALAAYTGDEADEPGTCAPGYHFASLYEILDVSQLQYVADLGHGDNGGYDLGTGPVTDATGWVRTGRFNLSANQGIGRNNCDGWSSSSSNLSGSTVTLEFVWNGTVRPTSPWKPISDFCDQTQRVWCVED